MSSVLRKKIEAGAGIPPTILHFHAFWENLQSGVQAWARKAFGADASTTVESRRVLSGDVAAVQFDGMMLFVFSSGYSPGVAAAVIDQDAATLNAAQRLQQSADDMTGISPLFMKLLFETSAISLWRFLSSNFSDHFMIGSQTPTSDLSQASGGFEPTERYLLISYSVTIGARTARFWVVFHLDYLIEQATNSVQAVSAARAASATPGRVIRESVRASMVNVDAVLERLPMTIGECSRLEVGQIIPLPEVNTSNISLRAETVNGSVDIGLCEMGVWKQHRALKLNSPILELFTRELSKL